MAATIARNQIIQSSRLLKAGVFTRCLIPQSFGGLPHDLACMRPDKERNPAFPPRPYLNQQIRRYSTQPSIWSSSQLSPVLQSLSFPTTRSFSTTIQRPQITTPKIPLQIRPIQASEESAFKALWSQYNDFYKRTIPDEVTNTTFARFLDPNIRMYATVALDTSSDNKVIGFITWYPHLSTSSVKEQVYAHDAFVDPSVRNMGAARAMIEYVYEHARTELGASLVYWHTQHYNHRAQLLYVKVAERTDFVKYQKNL